LIHFYKRYLKMMFWCLLLLALQATTGTEYSPVILIPGDGGNQLEAKLAKADDNTGCDTNKDWYRLWLDVWSLQPRRLRCWCENIKLVYNVTSRLSSNVPGVETRVPGWGDTSGLEYLDPSWSAWIIGDVGKYMKDLVASLEDVGLVKGVSIRGAPYDFRFAPHSQGGYMSQLKVLVEDTSRRNDNKPVTIISHSMGGLFGLHFLQNQDEAWMNKYIARFIPLNTPWIGAVLQYITYASGYNMGISVIDPLVIREEQRSYETGVYILPNPYNWPDPNEILVKTARRTYTVRDYPDFFDDIGFPQGKDMLNNVVNITRLEHPGVKLSCVYSLGIETPIGVDYTSTGSFENQPIRKNGDGDGTVTEQSLSYCRRWMTGADDRTMVFHNLNHADVLKNSQVLDYIKTQLVL